MFDFSLVRLSFAFALVLLLFQALNVQAGEKALPPSHTVERGDTLWDIARIHGVSVSDLQKINGIEGSKILVGQKLRLRTTPEHNHIVERGDSLWEIAHAYGMTVKELKKINVMTSDRIYPGQKLQLGAWSSMRLETYTVKKGDYLARIARLHQMSVSEIKKLNGMRTSVIYPGQELKVNPILRKSHELSAITEIPWDDLMASSAGLKRIPAGNGPYYGQRPKANQQPNLGYYEGPPTSVTRNYRQARKLWLAFDREITRLGKLSDRLMGWHFVLDPGHGGLDPGAVVENLDGNGNKIYVVEDEYVYDLALRVYVMLRLHGAEVTMTLISPNHIIRRSNPPVRSFVNEQNEVYNNAEFNKINRWSNWPNGGPEGNLLRRVAISRKVCEKAPKNRCVFLSFHADIDHSAPEAPLVLYYESRNGRRVDSVSRNFSSIILPALGAGARARGQNLGVLRNNPARIKVVLELRNLAYIDHAWALRFEQLRQRDAEKVVRGMLNYVEQTS